ncbi:MAG: hypothetical protein GXO71_03100 [Caldiserica bacterium]|nr:hypothetical protein [Caldisericota bacterium]
MKLLPFVRICVSSLFFFALFYPLYGGEKERAKELWEKGRYKEAGDVLWNIIKNQEEELDNRKKVIEFYRREIERLEREKKEIGRGVEQATVNLDAARLFREGWKWQHKGIFEATGEKEKREYLNKAIGIFRQIGIRKLKRQMMLNSGWVEYTSLF